MNELERRYPNNPLLKRAGSAVLVKEETETTFENEKALYKSNGELAGEDDDDDDDDRREGRAPPRPTDSRGILININQERSNWTDHNLEPES